VARTTPTAPAAPTARTAPMARLQRCVAVRGVNSIMAAVMRRVVDSWKPCEDAAAPMKRASIAGVGGGCDGDRSAAAGAKARGDSADGLVGSVSEGGRDAGRRAGTTCLITERAGRTAAVMAC